MRNWLHSHGEKVIIGLIGTIVSTIAYCFTTFAQISYVDGKNEAVMKIFELQDKRLERIERALEKTNELLIRDIEKRH